MKPLLTMVKLFTRGDSPSKYDIGKEAGLTSFDTALPQGLFDAMQNMGVDTRLYVYDYSGETFGKLEHLLEAAFRDSIACHDPALIDDDKQYEASLEELRDVREYLDLHIKMIENYLNRKQ